MDGHAVRKDPQVIASYAAVAPQLKGIERYDDPYFNTFTAMAMVHVDDQQILVAACALKDWLEVVDRAMFTVRTYVLDYDRKKCLVGWAQDNTARFYAQNANLAGELIWEVYL